MDTRNSISEQPVVVKDWPMSLEATRAELEKARKRLERYQAVLRLANSEIQQRNRYINALTTFALQASRVAQLGALLKLGLVQALETTEATVGAVILIDSGTKELAVGVHRGLAPNLIDILTGQELENGATALMPHLVAGEGALLEYESADDPTERFLLANNQLTSLVSLPLQVGTYLTGTLLAGLQGKNIFKPSELCFLMALSQEIAIFLDSVRLREELWHTAEIFLGEAISDVKIHDIDSTDINLGGAPVLDLPLNAETVPQPAEDDLEQLLAAMMEAEDELQQQNADLQTLNTIAEMINGTLDLKQILQCAVEQSKITLKTDAAWLYLVDGSGALAMRAHVGLSQDYVIGMHRLRLGEGLEGQVALEYKAQLVESISQDSRKYKIWVDKEGLQALAAVPITRPEFTSHRYPTSSPPAGEAAGQTEQPAQSSSHVIGVLATGKKGTPTYVWSPREIRLLTSIANQVALAIDNARLYAELQDDEAGLRAGNEVMRTINDMMLRKNACLEGFIQDDLSSGLNQAAQIVQQALAENSATLTDANKLRLETLQKIVESLSEQAKTVANESTELGTEVGKMLDEESTEHCSISSTGLPGFEKKGDTRSSPKSSQQDSTSSPSKPESSGKTGQALPKAMSFEEAVAAGLVPSHILQREKKI